MVGKLNHGPQGKEQHIARVHAWDWMHRSAPCAVQPVEVVSRPMP